MMFSDESLDPIDFKSTWKKERSVSEIGCQTKELESADVAVQSLKRKNREVQTDEFIEEDIQLYEDDSGELNDFCRRIEGFMLKELQKVGRSHAFDGYEALWGEDTGVVLSIHTLTHTQLNQQLQVTGLSWNSTGSVIAASYGRFDHEDWCTHKSALCTWNLDRRGLDANKADTSVDLSSCLMCIACHPKKPSWIAGGTFNGEVMVWDTSKEDEMLIATSGIGDDSHREPVTKVQWMVDPDSKGKKYHVVSVSQDGKVLVWRVSERKQVLKLTDGYMLLTESLPRELRVKAKRGDQEMGVTCISYSPLDDTTFLLGSDSGGVFKCSTNARGTPAAREVVSSVPLSSPVTFCYSPHHGPVYSVECTPYHRNLFLSCGTDHTARVYSMLQAQPLLTLEPACGYLYSAQWSPVRPLVVAVATENGMLLFYDLRQNRAAPVLRLEAGTRKQPVYCLQFNPHQTELLATGDAAGNIQVWKLNEDLSKQHPKEQELLEELAGSTLE